MRLRKSASATPVALSGLPSMRAIVIAIVLQQPLDAGKLRLGQAQRRLFVEIHGPDASGRDCPAAAKGSAKVSSAVQ